MKRAVHVLIALRLIFMPVMMTSTFVQAEQEWHEGLTGTDEETAKGG